MMKGEKLLYQDNKLAYNLVLAFIVLNLIVTIFVLRSMSINVMIGVFVMYNIIISLISFLVAIKVKKYAIGFGVFSALLGVLQFFMSFIMPKLPDSAQNLRVTLLTIASSAFLVAGGAVTILKGKTRRNLLKHRQV